MVSKASTYSAPEVLRRLHAAQKHRDGARLQRADDLIERRLAMFGIEPAQRIIRAELEDDALGVFGHGPVEAREAVLRRIAGNAPIGDRNRLAARRELALQHNWKAASAGRPKPAVRLSPSATRRKGPCARVRALSAGQEAAATSRVRRDRSAPWFRRSSRPSLFPARPSRASEPAPVPLSDRLMSSPIIKLGGVDLSLGRGAARVHILRGISLEVGQGEAVGLVGPSGSGKSSLLMAVAGLERVDSARSRSRTKTLPASMRMTLPSSAVETSASSSNPFISSRR